jgi:hypothetical protein
MKTKESNRLIAEFMGVKPIKESPDIYTYSDMPWISVREDSPEKVMDAITEYVKYDKEWNWLMPVVEKISGYYHKTEIGSDEESDYCRIIIYDEDNVYIEEIFECGLNTLEATYKAVIEFILWYNKNY